MITARLTNEAGGMKGATLGVYTQNVRRNVWP